MQHKHRETTSSARPNPPHLPQALVVAAAKPFAPTGRLSTALYHPIRFVYHSSCAWRPSLRPPSRWLWSRPLTPPVSAAGSCKSTSTIPPSALATPTSCLCWTNRAQVRADRTVPPIATCAVRAAGASPHTPAPSATAPAVGATAYQNAKAFTSAVADAFDIGINRTRVGVVTYSTNTIVRIPLNATRDYCRFDTAVKALPYAAGWTATWDGIRAAHNELISFGRPRSMAVPKIMVIVTDGQSQVSPGCTYPCSTTRTVAAANAARAAGISVVLITIGPARNFFAVREPAGGAGATPPAVWAMAAAAALIP